MYKGPSTTSTTTTRKPFPGIDMCFPKDANPLPAEFDPIPPFVNIIECGSTQYCEPHLENAIGYLELFIISYLPKS